MTTPARLEELRRRHPALDYESYAVDHLDGALRLTFVLRLEPDIVFRPTLVVPVPPDADLSAVDVFAFNLGLMESISYWKAACPPILRVSAGPLTTGQVAWWRDLYMHGLGEFFFQNDIDFTASDFLTIVPDREGALPVHASPVAEGDLLMVAGGKDSAVSADVLRAVAGRRTATTLNRIDAAERIAAIAGLEPPIVLSRTIDPALLRLNAEGYLNGHTPFSAYLAFVGTFVAAIGRFRRVIVSNERSASAPQAIHHGAPINHQYSKSYRFETRFREYAAAYLAPDIDYFSFLRPLHELQVMELFAARPQFHAAFRSCNVGQATDSWCGNCAKCAFVYLSLGPFLDRSAIDAIFGRDLLAAATIRRHLHDLLGLGDHVPFDCVGTEDESRLALRLTIARQLDHGLPVAPTLLKLAEELDGQGEKTTAADWGRLRNAWSEEHHLPAEYALALRTALEWQHDRS